MKEEKILDISWGTIFKIFLAVIIFYFLFLIKGILMWFVFALVISVLFNPLIDFLERKAIPRIMAVILVYFLVFGLISFVIYLTIPLFTAEIKGFLESFPEYFSRISPILRDLGFKAFENVESFLKFLNTTLEEMADNIFNILFAIFGGVLATLFVVITAIFLSLEKKAIEKSLILFFPKKYEVQVFNIWTRCQKGVISWFGVRILGCLFVGLASYVSFLIFKVKYSFVLALLVGVFDFIPFLGPLLVGILLFFMVFPLEPLKGILVLIVFVLIQQIENHILFPVLMKKFMDLSPVLVLFSVMVGAQLWGFLGSILAIPLFGIIFIFLKEFLEQKRKKDEIRSNL